MSLHPKQHSSSTSDPLPVSLSVSLFVSSLVTVANGYRCCLLWNATERAIEDMSRELSIDSEEYSLTENPKQDQE